MKRVPRRTGLAPGMTKVGDWLNVKVETVKDMRNGLMTIPAGTIATVSYARAGLSLETEPCACCGVSIRIRGVSASDVRLVS